MCYCFCDIFNYGLFFQLTNMLIATLSPSRTLRVCFSEVLKMQRGSISSFLIPWQTTRYCFRWASYTSRFFFSLSFLSLLSLNNCHQSLHNHLFFLVLLWYLRVKITFFLFLLASLGFFIVKMKTFFFRIYFFFWLLVCLLMKFALLDCSYLKNS